MNFNDNEERSTLNVRYYCFYIIVMMSEGHPVEQYVYCVCDVHMTFNFCVN